jgi:uncharacterized protein (TIGR02300 family)
MTKPELSTKRLCVHCEAKFYDLNQSPITCPKCGAVFEPVQVSTRWPPKAVREVEPVAAETQDANAEGRGTKKPAEAPEAEDDVELDDESLNGATLIEESEEEDADVTEIIGGYIEIEKGT